MPIEVDYLDVDHFPEAVAYAEVILDGVSQTHFIIVNAKEGWGVKHPGDDSRQYQLVKGKFKLLIHETPFLRDENAQKQN